MCINLVIKWWWFWKCAMFACDVFPSQFRIFLLYIDRGVPQNVEQEEVDQYRGAVHVAFYVYWSSSWRWELVPHLSTNVATPVVGTPLCHDASWECILCQRGNGFQVVAYLLSSTFCVWIEGAFWSILWPKSPLEPHFIMARQGINSPQERSITATKCFVSKRNRTCGHWWMKGWCEDRKGTISKDPGVSVLRKKLRKNDIASRPQSKSAPRLEKRQRPEHMYPRVVFLFIPKISHSKRNKR